MTLTQIRSQLFSSSGTNFDELALSLFRIQAQELEIYKAYINQLQIDINAVEQITDIPFLPINFFKSHQIVLNEFKQDKLSFFQSSGTSGLQGSKHYIVDESLYIDSFMQGFNHFFGNPDQFVILGLLPSYLENGNSSLVFMVDKLTQASHQAESGFYLHNYQQLAEVLAQLNNQNRPVILFGVTYALLDFATQFPMPLNNTQIIETGGMKGRREELTRKEVHQMLQQAFSQAHIQSEYGMTELFSQAYSMQGGIFNSPPWMKLLIRDVNDPFEISSQGKGLINCIDLANLYSCAFLATDDLGEVHTNGSFSVNGRLDHSELRGCSLLAI
ncbi:MAG: acyl transferase [Chitinophagaceae bacterium]|nr:acyl transferase [Chitinophagaceae bacterium]